jgi:heterodisulfide reductase subunit A-like polyferredoxin
MTQGGLEQLLAATPEVWAGRPAVVMIQCVGSREPEHPYCSRVCCSEAVKNAIRIKELAPDAPVFVLYRDIRTFGFRELYYQKARKLGVRFLRFIPERPPEVAAAGEQVTVNLWDANLNAEVRLVADYLVLSAALRPQPDHQEVAQLFKLPYDRDGFFMEAHVKLRPLDVATPGFFLCGLAHGPKFAEESIVQAQGAAARALTVLTQENMWIGGAIARVVKDRCAVCLTCVRVCPFQVPAIAADEHRAYIDPAKCKGCGICVSECPHRAIQLMHTRDEQVLPEIVAALA